MNQNKLEILNVNNNEVIGKEDIETISKLKNLVQINLKHSDL